MTRPSPPLSQRLSGFGHLAALVGLGPVLAAQGAWTRRKTPVLPEPPGPRQGVLGQGPDLRLLIAGDSAAAGVGADHQSRALSGQLGQMLARDYRLFWRLEARLGWRSADLVAHLGRMPGDRFDVALLSLGVNDVTGRVGLNAFLSAQCDLTDLLAARFGIAHVFVTAVPPMGQMTALPQPLRAVLGQRARLFNAGLDRQIAADPRRTLVQPQIAFEADMLARDGFHPSHRSYQQWAHHAATQMRAVLQQERGEG